MLVYTFRTYPYIEQLQESFPNLFIFGKLKEDMAIFKVLLRNTPTDVLGIADTHSKSRLETVAVNRFNSGTIIKAGPDHIALPVSPQLDMFESATQPTSTFCNWTMYSVAHYMETENLPNYFSFVHINKKDIERLKQALA